MDHLIYILFTKFWYELLFSVNIINIYFSIIWPVEANVTYWRISFKDQTDLLGYYFSVDLQTIIDTISIQEYIYIQNLMIYSVPDVGWRMCLCSYLLTHPLIKTHGNQTSLIRTGVLPKIPFEMCQRWAINGLFD